MVNIKNTKMFSSMLLCILFTSVRIMGALQNHNGEIAETPQRPMEILTFHTKEDINGETNHDTRSCWLLSFLNSFRQNLSQQQTENPISSLDVNIVYFSDNKVEFLSGNEVEITELPQDYNIKYGEITFLFSKKNFGLPAICHVQGDTSYSPSFIYKAILFSNPDGTLTFNLDHIKLPSSFEESSFINYLQLLRDFIDYSSPADPTKIKSSIQNYINDLQIDLKNYDNSLERFVKILTRRIDEFPSVFPHLSKRVARYMMDTDDGARLLLKNLDKFYFSKNSRKDPIYVRLKEAADMFKKGIPFSQIPKIDFVRNRSI